MKILVTGANGYIGQGVIRQLLNDGHEVIATDINCDTIDKRVQRIEGNIFNVNDPFNFFSHPDVLLHLAWRNGFIHNSETHIEDLAGHFRFLKSFIDSGIGRIAVLGTMHEVGFFEGSINENTPTHPQSMYGIAKDALRNILTELTRNSGTEMQWIRGFYIVGNTQYGNSIFSKIATAEKEGKYKFPFTSGKNQYDFLDYDSFCYQVSKIVSQSKINGIINACSGYPEKLADRVERFIAENEFKIKLDYGTFPDRPYDSKAVWGDNTKVSEILNK